MFGLQLGYMNKATRCRTEWQYQGEKTTGSTQNPVTHSIEVKGGTYAQLRNRIFRCIMAELRADDVNRWKVRERNGHQEAESKGD
jgi:hypothetical protein